MKTMPINVVGQIGCIIVLMGMLGVTLAACGSAARARSTTATATATSIPAPTPTLPSANAPHRSHALVTYQGQSGGVIGAAWSPDGKEIVTAGNDGTYQMWDAATGNMHWTQAGSATRHYDFVVAWSPDGAKIAVGGSEGAQVLDATTGKVLASDSQQQGFIEGIAWSPDGREVASGSQDNSVDVWDAATGKVKLTYSGHTDSVAHVAWSPDGSKIASASYDKTVQIWNAATGKTLLTYTGNGAPVWSVAWSPDGKRLASGTGSAGASGPVTAGNTVQVWDATTGKTLVNYAGHGSANEAYALSWSPDGTKIATGGDDKTVQIWDAATGKTLLVYVGHSAIVFTAAWSPDGHRIVSGSVDSTAQVWSAS